MKYFFCFSEFFYGLTLQLCIFETFHHKTYSLISKDTIEKVFETARVEEVIGDFVQLKRAGSNLKGLSPFVNEKSPSFMVSPVKQIWKDFSSGKGGNAVTFLMEHEHFTYPEAIKYLAVKYNIEIKLMKRKVCIWFLNSHKNIFIILY
jgi:DNA primase